MIRFTYNDNPYTIRFAYGTGHTRFGKPRKTTWVTIAPLRPKSDTDTDEQNTTELVHEEYLTGVALCHPKDRFDKDAGRRRAIQHAIKTASEVNRSGVPARGFTLATDKNFRLAVWNAYHNRVPFGSTAPVVVGPDTWAVLRYLND